MPLSPEAAGLDDLFNEIQSEPMRDQYGRPLLIPPPGHESLIRLPKKPRTDGRIPYTRASSFGGYVTDHSALETWRMRSLTKGLGEREDLAAMAAGLPPIHGNVKAKETLTKQEVIEDRITNARLDEIAEAAMVHANRDFKAHWGTAVHSFTDPGEHGDVPERMKADVDSWHRKTRGWIFHGTEIFVANDRHQVAGTFDHIVEIPWRPDLGRIVVDKKTGLLHPDQFCVQLFEYADGVPYDITTDERVDWPDGIRPNQDWALLAHIPLGVGQTFLYLVDLKKGRLAADVAAGVRAHRSDKDLMKAIEMADDAFHRHLLGLIEVAESRETLLAIKSAHEADWSDTLTQAARARVAALSEETAAA